MRVFLIKMRVYSIDLNRMKCYTELKINSKKEKNNDSSQ